MKEEEIRKREVFNEYLRRVKEDVEKLFDFSQFLKISCPSCGAPEGVFSFDKDGFRYEECEECDTLFVNPRPSEESLSLFYRDSPSTSYWVNDFFKPVMEARREKIFIPRAQFFSRYLDKEKSLKVADIGAGFALFLEELKKISPNHQYIAIEPSKEMAEICQSKGLEVIPSFFEEIEGQGQFNVLSAFELVEHLLDPKSFFQKAFDLLKPGGLMYITTLNGKGFDILNLWEKSKSIFPPHHLNFFNLESLCQCLESHGFKIEEADTPGQLDWDIFEGMIKEEGFHPGRFFQHLSEKGSQESKSALQEWIKKYHLSSHMRILARKPN